MPQATIASFAIALLFFALEFFVYETVSSRTVLAPGIIACTWVDGTSMSNMR